jgi:threonine dehydrogenase-like Zn-dependent dehydrogenase
MQSRAAVIFGTDKVDVRLIDLPEIGADEILMRVVSSSMCLSTYKAMTLGSEHKRVPDDIEDVPVMTGHEFAGVVEQVGPNLATQFTPGQSIAIQPAMGLSNGYSPGYSYPFYGGDATLCIIPKIAIDKGCVLPYEGNYFANGSLAEPMSCIIGAFHASYHTEQFIYEHQMGIRAGGSLALLGCGGAMGAGAIDYALHGPYHPRVVVAMDTNEERLQRLQKLFPPERAAARGVTLVYLNSSGLDPCSMLMGIVDGRGFDDVMVFAAHQGLVELGGTILTTDGCLNFFAGPMDKSFVANLNFYKVHYERIHLAGTSGGSRGDMQECLELAASGGLNPSLMVTHVGGLNAVPDALRNLPTFTGGKILAYPQVEMDLTAIEDFVHCADLDARFGKLAEICARHENIWNEEAERYLLDAFALEPGVHTLVATRTHA